ncbi:MAG TPA: Asp-tRNA(Asn)/Glu-tRNA(Gln) amidotransferase subunit GatA [Caldisericia bacterium]|nr:Asp-tRNA(Asn)/Glu-tRNA(Gln) amidotransferase subunit GatA [Caldisericia bacterium]HPF48171.1 Asp-tRNA(Asn)/Glu-tRNA(Gln) amidotransferase subunit GatA [Caldisericia bacterium]HPI83893.1 Asp-tRNA(Asn)/Glu-tRNA(Gln) amidotransferase subunit GatA [Caldisericia bacterium]HPQ92624.1 Asp-tRNA(Asn)/Glu-tRNA(Gln) amidotransferase subunit GatA [Caldisericia bacterium]HRV74278.1 Asp-tRNA(Asn)/Glu-tRNA(Gln) amidotransferase subunit GatA [Caldisericia bacterium]
MTIVEAKKLLAEKKLSPQELLNECKVNFDNRESTLNAFITPLFDDPARGNDNSEGGSLSGIPIAIKDNIAVKDIRLTCASKILGNYKSLFESTVTTNLRNNGAVLVGKTNLDEFAMGFTGEFSSFGATKNPVDESLVPGGSSSGSAAAVGSGMALGALGSDTGGSVRQPAAFCGLVGVRPTYGTVSRYGLVAFSSSLDVIGPIAKRVDDAKLILESIRGCDSNDSTSVAWEPLPTKNLDEISIGIPEELSELAIDSDVLKRLNETKAILEKVGVKFVSVSQPSLKHSISTYFLIAPSECSANLSRFDGVRYGLQVEDEDLKTQYTKTRTEGFGAEVRRRILIGTYALSEGFYDDYYIQACRMRAKISHEIYDSLKVCDALLTPTTPSTAFKFGSKTDILDLYACDMLTIPQTLAGIPAISVPAGVDGESRPIGMQLSGKAFSEDLLFDLASAIEREMN